MAQLGINTEGKPKHDVQTYQQQQQGPQDVTYDNRTAQQQQHNQYKVCKTDTGNHAAVIGMTYMPCIRQFEYLKKKIQS